MSTNKPWDRPWSMDEIIENSDKWNLAGDVALLNTLKSFADNLIKRTNEINTNLQNLTNNLDETSLQLNIAQNEFQNLRNSQFTESRVYEDDESLPKSEEKPKVEENNSDHTEDVRLAAVKGLEVLEQYFDKVEVSVSDSEDEDIDLPNYVLRPKDLYIDRPLPYIIGSDEWHKNWHVGLEDSSGDSETEKVSDTFSESDSESDVPIIQDRSQIKGTSDTSSELDFSQKNEPKMNKNDFFHSSDSENSVPTQGPISNKNFAEQLAAKLGHVITQEYEEPEVNRRPIQTQKLNYGDIFFDEPPPLDEPKGMFSGGGGLFDDDDEDIPYSTPKETKIETLKAKTGLFDDSYDDIFVKKNPSIVSKPPLLNDEPPALDAKKKPVGGVSVFGGANLFDKLRKRVSSDDEDEGEEKVTEKKKVDLFSDDLFKPAGSGKVQKINLFDSDDEDSKDLFDDKSSKHKKTNVEKVDDEKPVKKLSLFDDEKTEKIEKEEEQKPEKKISLFDDDDLFKGDLFSSTSTKKFTSSLFDDIPGDDLFSTNSEEKVKSKNLFEDLVANPNKKSINNDVKSELDSTNTVTSNETVETSKTCDENNLFSSSPNENIFVEEKVAGTVKTEETAEKTNLFTPTETKNKPPLPKPRLKLLDSPPPEPDDLFNTKSSDLFSKSPPKKLASPGPAPSNPKIDFTPPDLKPSSDLFATSPPKIDHAPSDLFSASPPKRGLDLTSDLFEKSLPKTSPAAFTSDLFAESPPTIDPTPSNLFAESPPKVGHALSSDLFANIPSNELFADSTSSSAPSKTLTTPTPTPNMRLFDPSPPPDDDWESKSDNLSENDDFANNDFEDVKAQKKDLFSEEPPSLDFKSETSPRSKPKPGKLKHNLNINVGALMPGYVPVKRVDGATKISRDQMSSDDVTKTSSDVIKADDGSDKRSHEGAVTSLDQTDEVEVLHSVTKDRVKVPLRRRPSTRKGRKEALRHSVGDFKLSQGQDTEQSEENDSFENSPVKSENKATTSENSPILSEKEKNSLFDKTPEAEPEEPSFLHKSPPHLSEETSQNQPKNILFDDDDEGDLFSTKKPMQPTKTKKSLFDDDDDDDDIFGNFRTANVKKTDTKVATEKKIPKVSSVKKLENTKPDDDPLSALLK